tara:strand:- start:754 stop:1068 length:315 start_codon:yes stop_codon:yes gene_type:complete
MTVLNSIQAKLNTGLLIYKGVIMTVKEHITMFIKYYWNNNIATFKTRNIQSLSESGKVKFGYRLGSPDTYTRTFRTMKENGDIKVTPIKGTTKDNTWYLEGHSL